MDFSMAVQDYMFDCKIRKLSPKTIDNYTERATSHHGNNPREESLTRESAPSPASQ